MIDTNLLNSIEMWQHCSNSIFFKNFFLVMFSNINGRKSVRESIWKYFLNYEYNILSIKCFVYTLEKFFFLKEKEGGVVC